MFSIMFFVSLEVFLYTVHSDDSRTVADRGQYVRYSIRRVLAGPLATSHGCLQ